MEHIPAKLHDRPADNFAVAPPRALVVKRQFNIKSCRDHFDPLEYFLRHSLCVDIILRYRATGEIQGHRLFLRQD